MGKTKSKRPDSAARKSGNALTTATLGLVLLTLVALSAGMGLLYTQQQQQAHTGARDRAETLARSLAAELAGQRNRDRQQLSQISDTDSVRAGLSTGTVHVGPWLGDTRLTLVPDGTDEQDGLSFTERDLLQQLRQTGQDTGSAQGGDHPAWLLAHAVPGGGLILEQDLAPWLGDAQRRLPKGAGLTLSEDNLTLARHGHTGGGLPSATAKGGALTITITVPARPVDWMTLLPAGATTALLLIIAIAAVMAMIARAVRGDAARLVRDAEQLTRGSAPLNETLALPALEAVRQAQAQRRSGRKGGPASVQTAVDSRLDAGAPNAEGTHKADNIEDAPADKPAGATLPESLFHAYDIRGQAGEPLSAEIVTLLGQAIGTVAAEAGQQIVFVARDGHLSSPELIDALIQGLSAAGRHVINLGMQPSPLLYFATETLESRTGVCLTGSDYSLQGAQPPGTPDGDTSLNIVIDGVTLHGEQLAELRQRILENRLDHAEGSVEERDISERYLRTLSDDIVLARPMSIAIDCGNGVTGALAPKLFEELGCKVVPLYTEVDGHFPNHPPNPGDPANLQALIDTVRAQKLDLGLAFDGDGDRLGMVSGDGEIIWADRLMMLFARDLLNRHPGADVIFDVKCSRALQKLIRKHGGRAVMYKSGHSLIKALMKEMGAPLAGEMNGHIFFADRWFGFDDGLYAGARLLEILSQEQGDSTAVFAGLRTGATTPELNVPVSDERKLKMMEALRERADRFPGGRANTVDGLRVDFPDGWGLVHASETMPTLVCRFEGRDQSALERVQGLFHDQLKAVDDSLSLPF